jgi:hypothetical protein
MKLRALILGIIALAFTGVAAAQVQQPAAETSITGTVVSSTGTTLVIRDQNGVEQTFDVDTSSTVPSGLMSGSRVTVRFHNMDGGRRHVASVTLSDPSTTVAPPATRTEPVPPATVTAPATAPTTPATDTTMPAPAPPAKRVQEPPPASDAPAGERLPDTAGELPLVALAGLMTLAAGLVLRELRRRDA